MCIRDSLGTYYISMNLQRDAFKDAKVRKALALAIDRDYVANTIMPVSYTHLLDKPLGVQYVNYMQSLLHGDLGLSLRQRGRTVNQIIASLSLIHIWCPARTDRERRTPLLPA